MPGKCSTTELSTPAPLEALKIKTSFNMYFSLILLLVNQQLHTWNMLFLSRLRFKGVEKASVHMLMISTLSMYLYNN